jgi:hypothetical protein
MMLRLVQPAITGVSLPLTQAPEEGSPKAIKDSVSMDVASEKPTSGKKPSKAAKKKGKGGSTESTPKTKKPKQ